MEDDENFFSDEHVNPEVCFPSCIRTFSVELDMKFLAGIFKIVLFIYPS